MSEKQSNKERIKEITAGIEKGIMELFESDRYRNYLTTMSRFHKYSLNNVMLIHAQRPNATLVAGFSKWKNSFGRHVKKGEKGIQILAPTPYKIKVDKEKLDPDTKLPMLDDEGKPITEEKEVTIGELIQRSNFLLKRIQHFHGSFRCLEREADIADDFPNLLLRLLRDFDCIFLWHLLHLPFQICKYIRSGTGFVCFCLIQTTLHHGMESGFVHLIPCNWYCRDREGERNAPCHDNLLIKRIDDNGNRNAQHFHDFLCLLLHTGFDTSHYICGFCCHSSYHLSVSIISKCIAFYNTKVRKFTI